MAGGTAIRHTAKRTKRNTDAATNPAKLAGRSVFRHAGGLEVDSPREQKNDDALFMSFFSPLIATQPNGRVLANTNHWGVSRSVWYVRRRSCAYYRT